MVTASIDRLTYLCDIIPALLHAVSETDFKHKTSPDKWSRQEELGHLIDSATNNHQRFIRAQYQDTPLIQYSQNDWVALNHYQELDKSSVIHFWEFYNRHLTEVWQRMSQESLQCLCNTGDASPHTLQFLIDDFVVHLEHHLRNIVSY